MESTMSSLMQDSGIKLIHGDCLEEMESIPDASIDMVLTDPPYGTTACKWDAIIPLEPMWEQLKRIIKPNGAIVLFGSQPFTSALVMSNLRMFKYEWVWEKSHAVGHLNAYKMPMKNIENICVFYRQQCTYNPAIGDKPTENIRPATRIRKRTQCYGSHAKESDRAIPTNKTLPKQTIKFNRCQENMHPTQKPVALMAYLVKTYTNKSETVLDFTMGSGTTGIACLHTGRRFIGIEKDPEYFEVAKKRLNHEVQSKLL